MATKPSDVPQGAIGIPPGQMFGPGVGVQQLTLLSIDAQISKQNNDKKQNYSRAMQDWQYNAQWAVWSHQQVPPVPQRPAYAVMHVEYATESGEVVPSPEGADGLHWAWTWETYDTGGLG